jgi:hypothetical protein
LTLRRGGRGRLERRGEDVGCVERMWDAREKGGRWGENIKLKGRGETIDGEKAE